MQLILKLEFSPAPGEPPQKRAWISDRQSMVVGRVGGDFQLPPDGLVSANHFRITCDGKQCLIEDLKSSNGTFLNDVPIKRARLSDGDQIRIGKTKFSVQITGAAPAAELDTGPDLLRATPTVNVAGEDLPARPERNEPVRFFNATPYQYAMIPGRMRFPGHSITLVVKGTFRLQPGKAATPVEDQAPILGPVPYDDAEHDLAAPRYEGDIACFKPKADLMLVGSCYPPGGQPAAKCEVEFRVGQVSRRLVVHGDRRWQGLFGGEASEPKPFTKMPLRYERTYGGEGFARNPTGIGHVRIDATEAGQTKVPLPNIEDPQRQMHLRVDKPEPVGFGPLNSQWEQRKRHLGTYDDAWVKERWPWFASNFNWAYCNAAPEALQCDHLRGDEEVYLENLLPDRPKFTARLPGRRVRCFLYETHGEERRFREAMMLLDTLWIDADAGTVTLVWRGVAGVASADLSELRSVYFMDEDVSAPRPANDCLAAFRAARSEWEAQWAGEEPAAEQPPPETLVEPAPAEPDAETQQIEALQAKAFAEVDAALAAAGIDPANPPQPTEAEKREALLLLRSMGIELPDDSPPGPPSPWTRQRVIEHLASGESLEGEDLHGLDLSGLKLMGANLTDANLEGANLAGADLTAAIGDGANLNQSRLIGTRLDSASFAEASFTGADLTKAVGAESNLSGARMLGADLTQAEFSDCIFSGAQLVGAKLPRARLRSCQFGGAGLGGAVLSEADLKGADLSGAHLAGANLTQANLVGANLAGADLTSANLLQVQAKGALFSGAILTDARLAEGQLAEADFSKAVLHRATFERADLTDANFEEADARQTNLTKAVLNGLRAAQGRFAAAKFHNSRVAGGVFTSAALVGADFSRVIGPGCDFSKANLERATLPAADLRESRFDEANLKNANLQHANLFQGSLAKADLTDADFRDANLFGVDFAEAVLERTKTDGANLKLSRLAAKA